MVIFITMPRQFPVLLIVRKFWENWFVINWGMASELLFLWAKYIFAPVLNLFSHFPLKSKVTVGLGGRTKLLCTISETEEIKIELSKWFL
jgi:hypothetical protein